MDEFDETSDEEEIAQKWYAFAISKGVDRFDYDSWRAFESGAKSSAGHSATTPGSSNNRRTPKAPATTGGAGGGGIRSSSAKTSTPGTGAISNSATLEAAKSGGINSAARGKRIPVLSGNRQNLRARLDHYGGAGAGELDDSGDDIMDMYCPSHESGGSRRSLNSCGTPDLFQQTPKSTKHSMMSQRRQALGDATNRVRSATTESVTPRDFPISPCVGITPTSKFSDRRNAMVVVTTLVGSGVRKQGNDWSVELDTVTNDIPSAQPRFVGSDDAKTLTGGDRQKFMYQRSTDVVVIMSDRIDSMCDLLLDAVALTEDGPEKTDSGRCLSHVRMPSAGQILIGGMVVSGSFEDSGERLSAEALVLQGSVSTSGGAFVELDLTQVHDSFSFFPGQVVVLRGTNPAGSRFVVDRIFAAPPRPIMLPLQLVSGPEIALSDVDSRINVLIAAAPFTSHSDLGYFPLADLIDYAARVKPHYVILIGPLFDETQPQLNDQIAAINDPPQTFQDFAECLFTNICRALFHAERTQVIYIPSARDPQSAGIYPTPALPISEILSDRLSSFPDPSVVALTGGINIGVSSVDFLLSVSKLGVESSSSSSSSSLQPEGDRMTRLLGHLLHQRSFYPLYPPPDELAIEASQAERLASFEQWPQILITPSDLRAFVKDVQGVCCVNPGRLARGEGGGTFCRLSIETGSLCQAAVGGAPNGSITDYVQAEIVRI